MWENWKILSDASLWKCYKILHIIRFLIQVGRKFNNCLFKGECCHRSSIIYINPALFDHIFFLCSSCDPGVRGLNLCSCNVNYCNRPNKHTCPEKFIVWCKVDYGVLMQLLSSFPKTYTCILQFSCTILKFKDNVLNASVA